MRAFTHKLQVTKQLFGNLQVWPCYLVGGGKGPSDHETCWKGLLLFGRPVVSDSLWPPDCSTAGFPVLHHFPELAQKPCGLQFELQFESKDHLFSSGFIKILSIMLLLSNLGNAEWSQTNQKPWSSEQRKVYCRGMQEDRWLVPPRVLEGFQQSSYKGKVRGGHGWLLQTSQCRNPLFFATVHISQVLSVHFFSPKLLKPVPINFRHNKWTQSKGIHSEFLAKV